MNIEKGQRYQHYKGKTYVILGVGYHTETLEKMVTYQGEYDDPEFGKNPIWVRPYEMFAETIQFEGNEVPRFVLLASGNL